MNNTVLNVSSIYDMKRSISYIMSYLYTNDRYDPNSNTIQYVDFQDED